MKGKKRILFSFILLLAVNLCGCGNDSDEQQIVGGFSITENNEDNKESLQEDSFTEEAPSNATDSSQENDSASVGDAQQDNMPVPELSEKTEVNGSDDLETNSKQEFLMTGSMGNLGMGTLVYTAPDTDGEDYRLYFFQSGNGEDRNLPLELSEASFIFPDVRDGNVPIGVFKEIYYMDCTDISRDGVSDVIVIAVYEKDGNEYYDTRMYEEREHGFVVNVALTQELNEKYYNAEDYPVGDIVALPGEEGGQNKYTIEGFAFADGTEKPVCVMISVESIQRGEEAYEKLQAYNSDITQPNENEEYIIATFNVSYDSGEIEELYMMENRASLEQAGLYFTLSNGQSNANDVTSYLSNSIYDITLTKGQSAQGAVAFLQEKGNTEPLVFVGFEQTVRFDIN